MIKESLGCWQALLSEQQGAMRPTLATVEDHIKSGRKNKARNTSSKKRRKKDDSSTANLWSSFSHKAHERSLSLLLHSPQWSSRSCGQLVLLPGITSFAFLAPHPHPYDSAIPSCAASAAKRVCASRNLADFITKATGAFISNKCFQTSRPPQLGNLLRCDWLTLFGCQ